MAGVLAALASSCSARIGGADGGNDAGTTAPSIVGARVRRLTRAEFDNTASAVLGVPVTAGQGLAPEDALLGYTTHDRLEVTSLVADQIDAAASQLATLGVSRASQIRPCAPGESEADCARGFIQIVGARAFRRPLTDVERDDLLGLYRVGREGADFNAGIQLALQGIFSSASFLYRTELGAPDAAPGSVVTLTPHELASALSYAITAGPPDSELVAAAESGALASPDAREAHARRLLALPAAQAQLHRFVIEWLGINHIGNLQKNNQVFPAFTTELRDAMRLETDAFIRHVLASEGGRVPTLLAADYTFVTQPLAAFYGLSVPAGTTPQRVALPPERAGILTHAGLLGTYAHFDSGAPILRGVFVLRRLMCRTIGSPPPGASVSDAGVAPNATTRARFAAHTDRENCAACHRSIDAAGYAFEDFDGLGQHRMTENGMPIDATGRLPGDQGAINVVGGAQLARELAVHREVAECAPLQLYRYVVGRDATEGDAAVLGEMRARYRSQREEISAALIALVRSPSFVQRLTPTR